MPGRRGSGLGVRGATYPCTTPLSLSLIELGAFIGFGNCVLEILERWKRVPPLHKYKIYYIWHVRTAINSIYHCAARPKPLGAVEESYAIRIILVRQYDLPSYETRDWRLIMRSKKCKEEKGPFGRKFSSLKRSRTVR